MSLKLVKKFVISTLLLLAVSACSRPADTHFPVTSNEMYLPVMFNEDVVFAEGLSGAPGSFSEYLRQEYLNGFGMAKDSAAESDYRSAEIFVHKAIDAGQGLDVFPEHPDRWEVRDPRDLRLARIQLLAALSRGGREKAPQDAAVAQARYDCWVEEAKEDSEPEDIARCRDEFWDALRRVQAVLQPTAAAPPPAPPARDYIVYFDFDKSNIRSDAASVLRTMIQAMGATGASQVGLVGHADRSGTERYNQGLSERRATAVKQFLINAGVPGLGVSTSGRGESDPRVPTPDGVIEQENRNVQIRLF